MRALLALFLMLAFSAPLSAAPAKPPTASAALFAERTALLAGDARCGLLTTQARNALKATTAQVRADALRDGWSVASLDGVAERAAAAGAARPCADAQLRTAAASVTAGFKAWATMQKLELSGEYHGWLARRTPSPEGFYLVQTLPDGMRFGILNVKGKEQLVLTMPAASAMPASARLLMRDQTRAKRPVFDVPGMTRVAGIAGAAAPDSVAAVRFASTRALDKPEDSPPRYVFSFPDSILAELAALDPREAIVVELTPAGGKAKRVYIEVGDIAVACAFLAARPA